MLMPLESKIRGTWLDVLCTKPLIKLEGIYLPTLERQKHYQV